MLRRSAHNRPQSRKMPHPFRVFIGSYLVMVLWSILELVPSWVQLCVILAWFVGTLVYIAAWQQATAEQRTNGHSPIVLISSIMGAQLPGIVLAGLGFWAVEHGHVNEWMNGGLEIWSAPFLRLWEWLPATSVRHLADSYLAACVMPYLIVFLQMLWWRLTARVIRQSGHQPGSDGNHTEDAPNSP